MVAPIVAGVAVISKFILTKGLKKAIKKYGKKAVDKATKSKTFKEMVKNPPLTTGQKAIVGGSVGMAGLSVAATGAGLKSISMAKDFNKLQDERKKAESKSKENIKVELLEEKQKKTSGKNKNPRLKIKNNFDTYSRG